MSNRHTHPELAIFALVKLVFAGLTMSLSTQGGFSGSSTPVNGLSVVVTTADGVTSRSDGNKVLDTLGFGVAFVRSVVLVRADGSSTVDSFVKIRRSFLMLALLTQPAEARGKRSAM